MTLLDVLVLGKGPAGLAAAAALCDRGLRVGIVGPPGAVIWPARYGAWQDELLGLGLRNMTARVWQGARVELGASGTHQLARAYALLDNGRLAGSLLERCERARAQWIAGQARNVRHLPAHSTVRLHDGRDLDARVVVDASGHRPALVRVAGLGTQGFQTAIGWTLQTDALPFELDHAILMDWNDGCFVRDSVPHPTFLYAMPLDANTLFVEETVLVGRPAVAPEVLETRLQRRCQALGIATDRILEREQVWIPMGGPLPSLRQRVVGFGAAAGMVHPATGYLLPRVLRAAPGLADALAGALGAGAAPEQAARTAWAALWPPDQRRRHALLRFGMENLLGLDAAGMQNFFADFFALPERDWRGYLADGLPAAELAAVMGQFFARASRPVRGALVRSALGPGAARLLADFAGSVRP